MQVYHLNPLTLSAVAQKVVKPKLADCYVQQFCKYVNIYEQAIKQEANVLRCTNTAGALSFLHSF